MVSPAHVADGGCSDGLCLGPGGRLLLDRPRNDQLAALDALDWEDGLSLRQGDLAITLETENKGFAVSGTTGIAVPVNETDNRFAFTFTMAVEP